jgi:hypothetical protein
MTTIEALNKIKQLFADAGQLVDPNPAPAPENKPEPGAQSVNMVSEYILKDGTKVLVDKLEPGGIAKIVDQSGAEIFAPVGEHELADGMIMVVGENGVISEVKPVQAAAPEVSVEVEATKQMKKKLDEMVEMINQMKTNFESQIAEATAENKKLSTGMSKLTDVIIGMCQTPSAEPTKPANAFSQHVESRNDKINAFLEMAKSVN